MEKEIEYKESYNLPEVNSFRARFEFYSSSPAPALNYSTISTFYPENFKKSLYFGKDIFGQTLGVGVWTGDCSGLPILRHKHH